MSVEADGAAAGDIDQTGTDSGETPQSERDADPQAEENPDDDQGDGEQGGRRNREAQYRHRAQAAEAERDTLRVQVEALQQDAVNEVTAAAGIDPQLLTAAGFELSSFTGEDGRVDRAKVADACTETVKKFNIALRRTPKPVLQQGAHGVPASGGGLKETINKALGR